MKRKTVMARVRVEDKKLLDKLRKGQKTSYYLGKLIRKAARRSKA